jgi:hypothetical protein
MIRTGMAAAGFDVLTIDEFWYKNNCAVNSSCLDANGRPQPDEAKWPSSAGGKGFKPFADKMHALGLKVGIHTLRGSVSSEAIAKKAPILGRYMHLRHVVCMRKWSFYYDGFCTINALLCASIPLMCVATVTLTRDTLATFSIGSKF